MAILYGVNATKLRVNNPPELAGVGEQGGRMRVIYDTYTLAADATGGTDTLRMGGLIPKGARIMEVMVKCADLDGSGGTLNVGWEASADAVESAEAAGFLSAIDVTTADVFMMSENAGAPAGLHKQFTAACQPVIAFAGDTDATSGAISIAIWYVLD